MTLDTAQLVRLGQLIAVCYRDGFVSASPAADLSGLGHDLVSILYADDVDGTKPYGILARDQSTGGHVVALRGTEGIWEWIEDGEAVLIDCPFLPLGCHTERGFSKLYASLRDAGGTPLKRAVAALHQPLTITGHSLGAALATLAAADCNADALVTFASPRVGDDYFCSQAADLIREIIRLVNVHDLVPGVPFSLLFAPFKFDHLGAADCLDSAGQVKDRPQCQHALATYLHLLDPSQPLDPECSP